MGKRALASTVVALLVGATVGFVIGRRAGRRVLGRCSNAFLLAIVRSSGEDRRRAPARTRRPADARDGALPLQHARAATRGDADRRHVRGDDVDGRRGRPAHRIAVPMPAVPSYRVSPGLTRLIFFEGRTSCTISSRGSRRSGTTRSTATDPRVQDPNCSSMAGEYSWRRERGALTFEVIDDRARSATRPTIHGERVDQGARVPPTDVPAVAGFLGC